VEGEHELPGETFVQRVLRGTCGDPRQHIRVPALAQHQVVPVQLRRAALEVEGRAHPADPVRVEAGERVAPPQPERRPVVRGGTSGIVRLVRRTDQTAEPV
jgi:hypothetical protein